MIGLPGVARDRSQSSLAPHVFPPCLPCLPHLRPHSTPEIRHHPETGSAYTTPPRSQRDPTTTPPRSCHDPAITSRASPCICFSVRSYDDFLAIRHGREQAHSSALPDILVTCGRQGVEELGDRAAVGQREPRVGERGRLPGVAEARSTHFSQRRKNPTEPYGGGVLACGVSIPPCPPLPSHAFPFHSVTLTPFSLTAVTSRPHLPRLPPRTSPPKHAPDFITKGVSHSPCPNESR
ncbi:hypothetical protein E2C01_050810 [Portunus trituberculatus]|uniref:Uncharacterized protein n=1 Tax=Portunus trituberculatus TaxID=210409 RepID=A0A5B7GHG8_PORTR|nr:hypothetical protein [Portunus trituberculatus]